jgi:hypothetical protein
MDFKKKGRNGLSYLVLLGTLTFLTLLAQSSIGQNGNANPNNNGQALNPNQEILEKLAELEEKVDALGAEQVTATFCISQGRAFDLGAEWAFEGRVEAEVGVGWAEVFSGEATAEFKFPFLLPSKVAVNANGTHGRNFDICVDLPIEMGPNDTALLAELATDINAKANDFPNRGKFQRRTHRLLNYTKLRVPGIQIRTDAEQSFASFATATEPVEGAEDEFDVVDDAIENLLSNGVKGDGSMFGVLKNTNISSLVGSFDALSRDVTSVIADPSQLLDPLSDSVNGGIDSMDCATFGIDSTLRNQKPGLEKLCNRLEGFPDYALVEQVLSGELIADLYEALDTLTIGGSASEVSSASKSRFCSSRIGQLFKYNIFCGRPSP